MSSLGVGLVGCGAISSAYLANGSRLDAVRFVACADVYAARAELVAHEHGLDACSPEALLRHPEVEVVLCLTPPDSHAQIAAEAIAAGLHVYTEKPLATSVDDARQVLAAADDAGLLVGCAPDTFLGAGIQTVRAAIEAGAIGTPATAEFRLLARPPERWHPSPGFLYRELAGPLMDLGPYGVTAAVELLGPIRRVAALAARARDTGVIAGGPRAGQRFPIAEPTRVSAVLEHDAGVLSTLTTTFDASAPARHGVEVHGSDGTLLGGDPNGFDGPVILARHGTPDEELPLISQWRDNARGLGLEDLCRAVSDGTSHRADGRRGLHVVEVLLGIRRSALERTAVDVSG